MSISHHQRLNFKMEKLTRQNIEPIQIEDTEISIKGFLRTIS